MQIPGADAYFAEGCSIVPIEVRVFKMEVIGGEPHHLRFWLRNPARRIPVLGKLVGPFLIIAE